MSIPLEGLRGNPSDQVDRSMNQNTTPTVSAQIRETYLNEMIIVKSCSRHIFGFVGKKGVTEMENRTRSISLRFRVTEQEQKQIERKMEQVGTNNLEAYLRKMAIDGYLLKLDLPEVRELIVQIRRYGNNLNQMAKRANETGSIYAKDVEILKANHEHLFALASQGCKRLSTL